MRYFTTSAVMSLLVLCETWLDTENRLIKHVCVLEADWEGSDRLVCICKEWNRAKWSSAHTAFDRLPWWQACLLCSRRFTPFPYSITVCVHWRIICQAGTRAKQRTFPAAVVYFTLLLLELPSVPASPFSQLPLPPSFVSSSDSLSLRSAASVFTLTQWYNISQWVSN